MKKHLIFGLFAICFILISCGDPATKGTINPVQQNTIISLTLDDILDVATIHQFIQSNPVKDKSSNDFFIKGVDSYKNKKQLDSAKYYFEHSIQQFPTSNGYYELGNVYKELKSFDQAILAYKLAEKLDFAPFSNLLYQIAETYSLKEDENQSAKYLEYAFQAGFTDLNKVNTEKNLEYLRSKDYLFTGAIKNGTRGMSNPESLFWLQFKRKFIAASLPLTLNSDISIEKMNKLSYISYDFERFIPEMRNAKFSRDVGESYYFAYNIFENENYTALIYIEENNYLGEYSPKYYNLTTFDSKGKIIDKIKLGQRDTDLDIAANITIEKSSKIIAKNYMIQYEKDTSEEGYWDNKIVGKSYLSTTLYKIDANGKITSEKQHEEQLVSK